VAAFAPLAFAERLGAAFLRGAALAVALEGLRTSSTGISAPSTAVEGGIKVIFFVFFMENQGFFRFFAACAKKTHDHLPQDARIHK
jgi:hypothetical protein